MLTASQQQSRIALLPTMIIAILRDLDVQTLLRCKEVCRLLAAVIDGSVGLKYKIELFAANMDDGPPSSISKADRLKLLQARQTAWKNLAWTKKSVVSNDPNLTSWAFLGGVLGLAFGPSLRFIQVPSVFRGIEEKEWTVENIGFQVEEFTMDFSRDLLVALEVVEISPEKVDCRFHLRSLSDGNSHPLLSREIVSHQPSAAPLNLGYTVEVFSSHLAVLIQPKDEMNDAIHDARSELVIWNWTIGNVEKGPIRTFSFLTNHLVMVGIDTGDPYLSLDVVDMNNLSDLRADISQVELVCSFHYPALAAGAEFIPSIRSEYPPSWTPNSTPEYPFFTSQNDRILAVESNLPYEQFVLFVHLSTILARINSIHDGKPGRIFPWEDWGPRDARMMSLEFADGLPCSVHGMKFVAPFLDGSGFQLYDLYHRSLKHLLLTGEMDMRTKFLTKEAICDEEGNMIEQPVSTSLPCLIGTFPSPIPNMSNVVLSEDALLMISDEEGFVILSF